MNENGKRNGYIRKIFGIVIVVAVSLGGAEMFLRIYDHYHPSFIFYKPGYNPFRGKPFSKVFDFQLNSQGFNDIEFPPKKKQTFRIVALGDSFAFGAVPHKNNYLTLLGDNLRNKGYNVEILNMGIPKTGPQDYADLLKEEGLTLKPDLVLVSLFMGNDFLIMSADDKSKSLRTQSYLLSLLYYIFSIRPYIDEGAKYWGGGTYDDTAPAFEKNRFLELEHGQALVFRYAAERTQNQLFDDAFSKLKSPLEELIRISNDAKVKITFVIMPDKIQIESSFAKEVEQKFGERGNKYDFSHPDTALMEWFGAKGTPSLDLSQMFRKTFEETHKQLYKPNDIHWNIAGNELAAEKIEKFLIQSSLLPAPRN